MLLWTINQLMHMTRGELCNLDDSLRAVLALLEAGTAQRQDVLTSIANIRSAMLRLDLHF